MKTEIVHTLTTTFEGHAQQTETGVEYWLARDLQYLDGYSKWDNFLKRRRQSQDGLRCVGSSRARPFCRRRENGRSGFRQPA